MKLREVYTYIVYYFTISTPFIFIVDTPQSFFQVISGGVFFNRKKDNSQHCLFIVFSQEQITCNITDFVRMALFK